MTQFNPETFMNTEVDQSNVTTYTPIPEGEYMGFIDEAQAVEVNGSMAIDLTWVLTDEELKKKLSMERVTVRQRIFIDLDDAMNIEFGENKNVRLGRLRDALGQNKPGRKWQPSMLRGAGPAVLKIVQNAGKDKITGEPTGDIFSNVVAVAKPKSA